MNHDEIYEIYLSDDDVRTFPLVIGEINDVTTTVFTSIRSTAVIIQLVSVQNNPGTVGFCNLLLVIRVVVVVLHIYPPVTRQRQTPTIG